MPKDVELASLLRSKKQTLQLLSISATTLKALAESGVLRPVRINKRVIRYRQTDIDTYLASLAACK